VSDEGSQRDPDEAREAHHRKSDEDGIEPARPVLDHPEKDAAV